MAKFILTKEKVVEKGEKMGLILQKHSINEPPPQKRIVDDYSYHQMRMEEFWTDK